MSTQSIIGEPEVLEDSAAWLDLKVAVEDLRTLQTQDGSIPDSADHAKARGHGLRDVLAWVGEGWATSVWLSPARVQSGS